MILAAALLLATKITLVTSDGSRNIAAHVEVHCGEKVWTREFSQLPRKPIEVDADGDCKLAVRAAGYKNIDEPLSSGAVYLHRLPVISGSVIDGVTRAPLAGAQIILPSSELLATTDESGRFRASVDGPWPSRLRVEFPGRAPRLVDVPKTVADADLPVVLSAGGNVLVNLAPPLGQESVRWEARRVDENERVVAGEVAAGQSMLTINALDPGAYHIVFSGEGPLQRLVVPVVVAEAAIVEGVAQIEPARLTIEVLRAGQPVPNAEVEMISNGWHSNLVADENGQVIEEIWQRGRYLAALESWSDWKTLDSGDEKLVWTLDVPDRVIRGRVADAATGKPLARVMVLLEMKQHKRRADTAADGTYEFKMVPPGDYTLRVLADGYRPLRTPPQFLADETHLEMRELLLQPNSGHVLRAITALGIPIASAAVFVSSRNGTRAAGMTGVDGRVTLPLEFDEAGAVFVLPPSGSFGVTRFSSMADVGSEEIVVTVPDGVASLEILARTTEGEPLGGMPFTMRVSGVLIPMAVKEAMNRYQGVPLASDANGRMLLSRMPPGRYEIWPLASRDDLRAVASAAPPPAPVNVMLMPGHQVATMVFRSAAKGSSP